MATRKHHTLDAVEMLRDDHERVQALFDKFEQAGDKRTKRRIVDEALAELKIHSALEEEIFYPAVRAAIDDDDLMDEAEEEHHVAATLIAELETMQPDDAHYDAKFTVLGESVQHHVREEESRMFPKARRANLDLADLAERMAERKQELSAGAGRARAPQRRTSAQREARRHE